jgi:hypothetical protein
MTREHGWLTADTAKPRTAPDPSLGTGKGPQRDARPIGLATLKLDRLQHARCVDHVTVKGLRQPACVLAGQDPAKVAREARKLVGGR